MNLNSLITGPARLGLALGRWAFKAVQSRFSGGDAGSDDEVTVARTVAKPPRQATAPPEPTGDAAITRKVETELFREGFAPKGKITVTTAEAIVVLRGEVDTQERSAEIEAKAAAITDVTAVENLLRVERPRRFTADETTPTGESPAAPFPTSGNGNGAHEDQHGSR